MALGMLELDADIVPAYVVIFLFSMRYKMRASALAAMAIMLHDIRTSVLKYFMASSSRVLPI